MIVHTPQPLWHASRADRMTPTYESLVSSAKG